jgi:hypothetical protein
MFRAGASTLDDPMEILLSQRLAAPRSEARVAVYDARSRFAARRG